MKQQMCARCGERPAVIYIQKMEGDEVKPVGALYSVRPGAGISALLTR